MDTTLKASLGLVAILLAAGFTQKPANATDYKAFTGEKTYEDKTAKLFQLCPQSDR